MNNPESSIKSAVTEVVADFVRRGIFYIGPGGSGAGELAAAISARLSRGGRSAAHVPLSARVRPGSEAALWVVEEIRRLEAELLAVKAECAALTSSESVPRA